MGITTSIVEPPSNRGESPIITPQVSTTKPTISSDLTITIKEEQCKTRSTNKNLMIELVCNDEEKSLRYGKNGNKRHSMGNIGSDMIAKLQMQNSSPSTMISSQGYNHLPLQQRMQVQQIQRQHQIYHQLSDHRPDSSFLSQPDPNQQHVQINHMLSLSQDSLNSYVYPTGVNALPWQIEMLDQRVYNQSSQVNCNQNGEKTDGANLTQLNQTANPANADTTNVVNASSKGDQRDVMDKKRIISADPSVSGPVTKSSVATVSGTTAQTSTMPVITTVITTTSMITTASIINSTQTSTTMMTVGGHETLLTGATGTQTGENKQKCSDNQTEGNEAKKVNLDKTVQIKDRGNSNMIEELMKRLLAEVSDVKTMVTSIQEDNQMWKNKLVGLEKDVTDIKESVNMAHNLAKDEKEAREKDVNEIKTILSERKKEQTHTNDLLKTHMKDSKETKKLQKEQDVQLKKCRINKKL